MSSRERTAAQVADARAAQRADAAAMIQLELDDTDKKQFAELQQAMGQAQQEQSLVVQKLRVRETEKRRSDLTLSELKDVDNSTKAYVQVGKMFLQEDLAGSRRS